MSKPTFKDWYKVVPVEKNDTTSYNLRRAYKIAPKEELDAFANSDAHLHSVYKNPKTGEYEFMKSVSHPSLLLELADYNSNPEFNQRYGVVPDGTYLKYVPYASGGPLPIGTPPNLIPGLIKTYLADYANRGNMYGYPSGLKDLKDYLTSPYVAKRGVNGLMSPKEYTHTGYRDRSPRRALFAMSFGLKDGLEFNPEDYVEESPYRPTNAKDLNAKYYRIKPSVYGNVTGYHLYGGRWSAGDPGFDDVAGEYKVDTGVDPDGRRYVSLYDVWDLAPIIGSGNNFGKLAKPIELYDRIYEDEKPDVYRYYVPGNDEQSNVRSKGGSIHINPANRGKFNATKARTGKTTEELTHSKNPLTRKRAIFAQNAAKWNHKHAEGGFLLDAPEYPADEEQTKYARDAKSSYGDTYYDIVNSRYTGAMNALRRKGFSYADAERLAPMIVTQNNLEGGWRLNRADNNFGGMRNNGKTLSFNSVDDFYDAYIDMLDEKWNNGSGYSNSWRYARNLDDWANVLNHEDLNLWSKERWENYNKEHKDNPAYLYAPEWENNGKKYREHLRGVEARTAAYLDMVRQNDPVENWDAVKQTETEAKLDTILTKNSNNRNALLQAVRRLLGR